MKAIPEAGDIAWIDFDPVLGTEQAGRRPAIVLTDAGYNERYSRSVVCPITTNSSVWPTKVALPEGLQTRGAILADQVRTVERDKRGYRFIEHAPDHVLRAVRNIIGELLQIADR